MLKPRRITAEDVAGELNISAMTVSRALNNRGYVAKTTRERVIKTARRLGFSPNHIAKSLAVSKTETIGVIVPEITHSFFPEAIRGIQEVTYSTGYHLILTHSAEDVAQEQDSIRTLESMRVDGILISMAQTVKDHVFYREVIARGIPLVFFDRVARGLGASCVSIDDEACACTITEHLIGHGYRRIAHLGGPQKVSIGRARLNGFLKALKRHRIPVESDLIVASGFHEADGYEAMKRLINRSRKKWPRAVFAVNDPAAFGAIKAILEIGLSIPKDIALVGFSDDIRAPLMPTPLTTIRQPAYELGKQAAQQLIARIEGTLKRPQSIIVQAAQVIRQSCGCKGAVQ